MTSLRLPMQIAMKSRRDARLTAPRTANQLHAFILAVLGFDIPRLPVVEGHDAPFAYVEHAFFEDGRCNRDCIVWANRGGGKTQIAAIATLLDLLFKPGIQIRILGGSFDQSSKMYRYLKQMLESDVFSDLIAGHLTGRHVELVNGSRVEVLSQSERSVRGQRVHKLRCDEVELFHRDVWEAAQLVTRSGRCGPVYVRAAVEALSTMHRPFGLMQELVCDSEGGGNQARRVFRWSALDVLRHCGPARACSACSLWTECRGRAKHLHCRGFLEIDDAIVQRGRVSPQTWQAEMLCDRPSRADSVYPDFDPALHVIDDDGVISKTREQFTSSSPLFIGGIDFGYRAPTVILWALVHDDGSIAIIDELSERDRTTDDLIQLANEKSAALGVKLQWLGADPAGHQRNEQTGRSTISMWQRAGWRVRTRRLSIEAGIEAVRCRLRRADGFIGLRIHRRCANLIEALTKYHFPQDDHECTTPVKDGPDHACDALRYMIINLDHHMGAVRCHPY
jgi:hypothetical protein